VEVCERRSQLSALRWIRRPAARHRKLIAGVGVIVDLLAATRSGYLGFGSSSRQKSCTARRARITRTEASMLGTEAQN
jgi:hypothetical protein